MYNQPYFIPGSFYSSMAPSMMRGAIGNGALGGAFRGAQGASRGLGLFSRLGSGLNIFKSINWGGLINNTSRTLNVVNQAIPLVRQVGPMMRNMKSVLKIASVFKDETDNVPSNRNRSQIVNSNTNQNNSYVNRNNPSLVREKNNNSQIDLDSSDKLDNSPTFFIG